MRKLNLVFLASLLVSVVVLSVATWCLHEYQVKRNASAFLDLAHKAETDGKLAKAVESLNHYLSLIKDDGETYKWYARLLDEMYAEVPRRQELVLNVYQEALRFNPDDTQLKRRCADLAMTPFLNRTNDARTHLTALLDNYPKDSKDPDPGKAEIEELLAECFARESKFEEADGLYEDAIRIDKTRLSSYVKLAELRRKDLRREPEKADKLIDKMVELNPNSGLAYLNRYKYYKQFPPPPKESHPASDLQNALKLAPDDAEVLLAAANNALATKKLDDARMLIQKGFDLHPKNSQFAIALANLELAEKHPDRAEAVLRKAYKTKPETDIAFYLARVLILEGKLEGEGQAEGYIGILRSRGFGDSIVRVLVGLMYMQKGLWNEAISEIEGAQAILKSRYPVINDQLTMMLAECYHRTGREEQRLAALQGISGSAGAAVSEASQLELAQALTKSGGPGELDQALRILQSLADRHPELELEIARLMVGRTLRQPKDQRDWKGVDRQIDKAAKALNSDKPAVAEAFTLLRAQVMEAKGDADKARDYLSAAAAKDPKNLSYVVTLSQIAMRQSDKNGEALSILDEAEKKLGRSRVLQLARLAYWGAKGGLKAKVEVGKIADAIKQAPAAEQPLYLEQLAMTEKQLGELALARQYLTELLAMPPEFLPPEGRLQILATLFDWTLEEGQTAEAKKLIDRIVKLENPNLKEGETVPEKDLKGTYWRFAQAAYLITGEVSKRAQGSKESPPGLEGKTEEIEKARQYAEEITAARPQWWGGPLLQAQIAELNGQRVETIMELQRAVELGYTRPGAVQKLISLLIEENRYDDVDRLIERLRNQTNSSVDLRLPLMVNALRKKDYKRAIPLAQELYENSPRYIDHLNLGRYLMLAEKTQEAGDQFRVAVEKGGGVPDTWVTYVKYLVLTGKLEEARNKVEEARKALPPDRSTLPLAECLWTIGENAQAEAMVEKALKEKRDDPATLQLAATFYLAQGRTAEGMKWLEALSAPAPGATSADLAWANRTKAKALLRTRRKEDLKTAFGLVERNLKDNPSSVPDLQVKAMILAYQPEPEQRLMAIEELEKLDEARDLEADDQFLLAQLYLNEKRDDTKYQDEMLKVLVEHKSTNPQHLANYVAFLISRKKLDKAGRWLGQLNKADKQGALALATQAILLKASNPDAPSPPKLRNLLVSHGQKFPELIGTVAALLANYGFPAEAETAYKEYIARDPKKPERVLALASFLAGQKGRTTEALDLLSRAWQTCPPEQVAMAALSLYDAPSVTEAQRKQVEIWLAEARRKRADLFVLSNKLAAIWIRQGRFDEAEELYRGVLTSNPDSSEALNNLAWLVALRYPDKTDEALEKINRAIKVQGSTASLIDTRAVVLIRAKKLKDAIDALNEATKMDGKNFNVALHLAWALRDDGKKDAAKAAFKKAVDLGWKADRSDPLERSHIDQVRQDLGL